MTFLFSRYIFMIIVSVPFILSFNALLAGLLISIVNEGIHHECVTMIKSLQLETISSTMIVWGVVLESRDVIKQQITHKRPDTLPDEVNQSMHFYGLSLVALGLIVEVMDYINHQFQVDIFNSLALEITAFIQWAILSIVLMDTLSISTLLLRYQFMRK